MSFKIWQAELAKVFEQKTGLDLDTFPDQDYYGFYEDGLSPVEAVAEAIHNEYGFMGLEAFNLVGMI